MACTKTNTFAALTVLWAVAAGCGGGAEGPDFVADTGTAFPGGSDGGTNGDSGGPVMELPDDGSGMSKLTAPLPKGEDYMGWTWISVPGSKCRDGSGAGYFWRRGKKDSLMVYLNGGGACADPFFCGLNPVNVNQDLPIEFLIFGTGNLVLGPDARR
ncbi:MAG TPA: hypothetical protein VFZ61_22595, partial [Polyangiales bacterium]